jgi:hypothetical protein
LKRQAWRLLAPLAGALLAALPVPALAAPAGVDLPADADGRPVRLEGQATREGWEAEVRPAVAGWLWVELDGPDEGPDLDLVVEPARTDGERRRATSHLPDESLLVAADPATPLTVRVVTDDPGVCPFRLSITPLAAPHALDPTRGPVQGVLDPAGDPAPRAVLVTLPADLDWAAARLLARRTEGEGEVDLEVLDARLDAFARADADGPEARCQPPVDPAGPPEEAPRYALLLGRGGPTSFQLSLERPDRGEKAWPTTRLEAFLRGLAATPEQRRALVALRRTPDFLRIAAYVEESPGLSLRLRAVPGLRSGGVERFGTYGHGTLTINPTIGPHRENVQELLDTLVHELVHALLDLPRGPRFPFGPDVLDAAHDPRLAAVDELPIRRGALAPELDRYLAGHYGPSASDPAHDYSDLNDGAQRLIVKVIEETLRRTGLGHETIVFESVRGRAGGLPSLAR